MTKTTNKKQAPRKKKKEFSYEIRFSNEPCTEEEAIQAVAKLCYKLFEMDRDYHRKKLQKSVQHCDYCGKEITELHDFCSPDDRNCCYQCGLKLLEDPNRQRTFCGIPVVSSKK